MANIKETLEKEGFIIHQIRGISMLPLLDQYDDMVKIEKAHNPLKELDMALFIRDDNTYILHRILKVYEDSYLISGDNQNTSEKVPFDKVIGIATGYFKQKRYVSTKDKEYLDYLDNLELDPAKRKPIARVMKPKPEWLELIYLIRNIIHDDESIIEIKDYEMLLQLACQQNMASFVFPKIDKNLCPAEIYKKWQTRNDLNVKKAILFEQERKAILDILDAKGIAYCPLKGIIISRLYPRYGSREFADNDILYDQRHMNEVKDIMVNRGYMVKYIGTGAHDSYLKEPCFNFEFHRILFEEETGLYHYFSNIWDSLIKDEDNSYGYHLSNEDFYLHFIGHFYKHYKGAGAGIRFFVDKYLIDTKMTLNQEYIIPKLKEYGLYEFDQEITKLTDILFNKDMKEMSIHKMSYIFSGTVYGLAENRINNDISKMGRLKYFFYRIFMPMPRMKSQYPILKTCPFLLPLMYIYRFFHIILTPEKTKRLIKEIKAFIRYNDQQ